MCMEKVTVNLARPDAKGKGYRLFEISRDDLTLRSIFVDCSVPRPMNKWLTSTPREEYADGDGETEFKTGWYILTTRPAVDRFVDANLVSINKHLVLAKVEWAGQVCRGLTLDKDPLILAKKMRIISTEPYSEDECGSPSCDICHPKPAPKETAKKTAKKTKKGSK